MKVKDVIAVMGPCELVTIVQDDSRAPLFMGYRASLGPDDRFNACGEYYDKTVVCLTSNDLGIVIEII